MAVETLSLDQLQAAYKAAVDQWISAIREEEALASGDHSEAEIDAWEAAGFREVLGDAGRRGDEALALGARRVLLGHHDDWLPGFSSAPDISPIRTAFAERAPGIEFLEPDYLAGTPIFARPPA